jgi:hypothetical protein
MVINDLITTENIRLLITCLSFLFGIWQYFIRQKVEQLISSEAIELHNNIAVALGATDSAIRAIQNSGDISASVGRAQGLCQAVLHESAKLYCNIKGSKQDDIDDLISSGQLAIQYRDIYYSYSGKRRGKLRQFIKSIKGLF